MERLSDPDPAGRRSNGMSVDEVYQKDEDRATTPQGTVGLLLR